jgi:glycosyltransferase involved in cell wall biosynthesis
MDDHIRVAFNASALPARPAGAGIYTLELGTALASRPDVTLLAAAPAGQWPLGAPTWETPTGVAARNRWEQRAFPAETRHAGADVVHGAHFATPLRSPVARVATVHDLTFYRLPRRYDWRHRAYYRLLARSATRAERIIVPSSAVANDVVRYLGYPVSRIRVIPEAPRTGWAAASPEAVAATRARFGLDTEYILMVGTAEPGKRAIDGIRALALLRERGCGWRLVLAGNGGPLRAALEREASRLGVDDSTVFAGYVDDCDLRSLYTGALALVFPSLYEGFGLPPLEAMACGTPVIATERPAMDSVLGQAALFIPPRDPAAIVDHIAQLAASPALRDEFSGRGREHASAFSWAQAASETVEVYREVARR